MSNKEINRQKYVCLGSFLRKRISKKHFVQLKMIEIMGRKSIFFLSLSCTDYAFGCKKYICKKCYTRNEFGFMVGICNICKAFVCFLTIQKKMSSSIFLKLFTIAGLSFKLTASGKKISSISIIHNWWHCNECISI